MTHEDNIREDLNKALKEKKEIEVSVLRMVFSAIQEKEKKKRYDLYKKISDEKELEQQSKVTPEELQEILSYEAKKRKESIKEFERFNRTEQAEKEKQELLIIEKYLPEQISEQELSEKIKETIEEVQAKGICDMGKVMAGVMIKVKGKADGSTVNSLVKKILTEK